MQDFVAFCRGRISGFDTIAANRKGSRRGNYVFRLQDFGYNGLTRNMTASKFRDHITTRLKKYEIEFQLVAFGHKKTRDFNPKAQVKDSSHFWVEIKLV
jgi:hypothetical protein